MFVWRVETNGVVRDRKELSTDDEGVALLSGIRNGTWWARGELGGIAHVDVVPSQESLVELKLEEGTCVRGRVLNEEGTAVPHAEVWLAMYANESLSQPSAVSGADGTFILRRTGACRYVFATGAGLGPSDPWKLPPGVEEYDVELVVRAGSSELALIVVGSAEELARGVVRISLVPNEAAANVEMSLPLSRRFDRVPVELLFSSLWVGDVRIEATAEGYATTTRIERLGRGERRRVEILLRRGATVTGFVTDGNGRPIRDATVSFGLVESLEHRAVKTSGDGGYTLEDVTPGKVRLHATLPAGGRVVGECIGEEGRIIHCNLIADGGSRISGRARNSLGGAVIGCLAKLVRAGSVIATVRMSEDGFFMFSGLDPGIYDVEICLEVDAGSSIARCTGVKSGDRDILITVDGNKIAVGTAHGRVLSHGVPPTFPVTLARRGTKPKYIRVVCEKTTGEFRTQPLPAGVYGFVMETTVDGVELAGEFEILAGQDVDVGIVRLN